MGSIPFHVSRKPPDPDPGLEVDGAEELLRGCMAFDQAARLTAAEALGSVVFHRLQESEAETGKGENRAHSYMEWY